MISFELARFPRRFGQDSAPRVSNDRKLWDLDHPLNRAMIEELRRDDPSAPLYWGESSPIANGGVKVGDLVYVHNQRQSSFRSANWDNHAVSTLREVATVITDSRGTLRIRVRKVGGKGKGGAVHWQSTDFTIANTLVD